MNILHINQSDLQGGAGLAGHRLHLGLLEIGKQSKQLVAIPKSGSPLIQRIPRNKAVERLVGLVTEELGLTTLEFIASRSVVRHPFHQEADIVNFHNTHQSFCTYAALPALTREKPGVLTLHDMWAFTGHCCYPLDCTRWQDACGDCPRPEEFLTVKRDGSRLELWLKKQAYQRSDIAVVAPSRYFYEKLHKSILRDKKIYHIPYGIDTEAYAPQDKGFARDLLGIGKDRRVLMFAAQHINDRRKGFDLLKEAVDGLPGSLKKEILVLLMGDGEEMAGELDVEVRSLGYIGGDHMKSLVYSAADALVLPTREDNLPLVLMECLACGVPMVSFDVGGVPEMVRPNETGLLAPPEDSKGLRRAIENIIADNSARETMSARCREVALTEYPLALQAKRYMDVYASLKAE